MIAAIIYFSILFRAAGGGFNGHLDMPRWMVVVFTFAYIVAAKYGDWLQVGAWCGLFVTYRLLATKPLLDVMNSVKENKVNDNAIIMAHLRLLYSLPFIFFIISTNEILLPLILFLQVLVYGVCGLFRPRTAMMPEMITGVLFGLCLTV